MHCDRVVRSWVTNQGATTLRPPTLPRIPIDEGSLATGGLIALAAIIVLTLLAAIAGGKAGERYHKKVDRAAYGG